MTRLIRSVKSDNTAPTLVHCVRQVNKILSHDNRRLFVDYYFKYVIDNKAYRFVLVSHANELTRLVSVWVQVSQNYEFLLSSIG